MKRLVALTDMFDVGKMGCWGHCCWWKLGLTLDIVVVSSTSLGLLIGSDWMFTLVWSLVDTSTVDRAHKYLEQFFWSWQARWVLRTRNLYQSSILWYLGRPRNIKTCYIYTFPKTNIAPENDPSQKETRIPSIFTCELLVFRGCKSIWRSCAEAVLIPGSCQSSISWHLKPARKRKDPKH